MAELSVISMTVLFPAVISTDRRSTREMEIGIERIAVLPNEVMQLTVKKATLFARAKRAPLSPAADPVR